MHALADVHMHNLADFHHPQQHWDMDVFSTPPQPSTSQQQAQPQQAPSSPAVFVACDTRQFPVVAPSPSVLSSNTPDAAELAAGAAKYPHMVLNFMVQIEYMFGKPHSPLPPLKGLLVLYLPHPL